MGEVFFYHLTQSPLDATLRSLLGKCLGAGWRVAVRGKTDAVLDQLDAQLWLGDPVDFLPHGRAGGAHDGDQPILLTTAQAAPNTPQCLISLEGAEITPEEVAGLTRAMILFDGNDPDGLQTARAQWRGFKQAGTKAKYWSEDTGRWDMKAET